MRLSLANFARICFAVSIIVQIGYISVCGIEQESDAAGYLRLAQAHQDTIYPTSQDIYSSYIFAPGYVNYLSVLLNIFGSVKAIQFINVFLSVLLALELYYLGKKYISNTAAYLVLLLYSFYPTTYGITYYTVTELPYTVLVLGILILYLKEKIHWVVICGLMTVMANWIRPFLPVLFLVILFISFTVIKSNYRWRYLAVYITSVLAGILFIGYTTQSRMGYFNFQSSTSGVNLIMGANDDADGSYEDSVFKEGEIGYIPDVQNKTFQERDQFWREQGVKWIKENPGKWLGLLPAKFFYMYALDSHSLGQFSGDVRTRAESRPYITGMLVNFPHWSALEWIVAYNQLLYMTVMLLALFGIWLAWKSKNKILLALILYWVLGTGMTLATVGGSRYHFPYMPIIFLLAALIIDSWLQKRQSIANE